MDKATTSALLGRSLTSLEDANFDLYIDIAQENVETLLCASVCGENTYSERKFIARSGFATIFTGYFSSIAEVKVDGVSVTDYRTAFWDDLNCGYGNSVILSEAVDGSNVEVLVTGTWGLGDIPNDLKRLIAHAFANVSKKYSSLNVKSKKVEDFNVTYGELSDDEKFVNDNAKTIGKYSLCNMPLIRHGDVCSLHGRSDCGCA